MKFLILFKFLYFSVSRRHTLQKSLFLHTCLCDSSFFLLRKNEDNSDNKNHRDV